METHVFIKFDSALDATHAKCYLDHHGYPVSFVTPLVYAQAKYQDPTAVDPSEGQIYLLAETPDATKLTDPNTVLRACIDILQDIGLVRGIAQLSDGHPFMLRVEFDSVDAANRAVQILTRNTTWSTFEKDPLKVTVQCKPWSEVRSGTPAVPETLILNGSAFRNHGFDQHNRVRRERILDGSDIRTTVMLRNIPNKMDWLSLKQLIDQHCLGSYDFLYLRIDFSTGCNVGYAFVNFVDTSAMIALLDHIEFRTWKGFRSAKAAEVSYATIQGREALVAKFRNSSVMHETPYCRPRLLISCEDTTAVTRIGTEIDFPGADNAAKLHRSIDNARSMGLFPPHAAGSADRARYGHASG
ncbi:hypothetical protein M011DRAFT_243337 [Sporormia fimetaria CBS 119925]|uniref:RRM domain-containing protein n=1 Tax=Sporormia fimetaria CBS 119925 TaxID=1340428 RepID=A0A6A6VIL1_9PLEO|nr:hypothetical protein M011DRAFT_243337 [Sporormia fimetaria CBS 119925]